MTESATAVVNLPALLSVDDCKPREEGGPIARAGFNYQDEIAVGFLIDMLSDLSILKVHCETHDDIVIVRDAGLPEQIAEYVQVKATAPDKLWSVADLCAQHGGKQGASIFEILLERDKHTEKSRFRLVTLRPVVSELKSLTFQIGSPGRESTGDKYKALLTEIDKRFPGIQSTKKNGAAYWLENCFWDERPTVDYLRNDNLVRLIRLGVKENRSLLPEHAELLLGELRTIAKAAGSAKWEPNRAQKIILRTVLREWWERRVHELITGVSCRAGGKLRDKMVDAELPNELVSLAADLRLDYATAARTPRYMESEELEQLTIRVKSELISLRARFIAGQLDLNGANYHSLCLARMDAVNAERPDGSEDRSAFLKGCMYDITDRCLHRFAKSVS